MLNIRVLPVRAILAACIAMALAVLAIAASVDPQYVGESTCVLPNEFSAGNTRLINGICNQQISRQHTGREFFLVGVPSAALLLAFGVVLPDLIMLLWLFPWLVAMSELVVLKQRARKTLLDWCKSSGGDQQAPHRVSEEITDEVTRIIGNVSEAWLGCCPPGSRSLTIMRMFTFLLAVACLMIPAGLVAASGLVDSPGRLYNCTMIQGDPQFHLFHGIAAHGCATDNTCCGYIVECATNTTEFPPPAESITGVTISCYSPHQGYGHTVVLVALWAVAATSTLASFLYFLISLCAKGSVQRQRALAAAKDIRWRLKDDGHLSPLGDADGLAAFLEFADSGTMPPWCLPA